MSDEDKVIRFALVLFVLFVIAAFVYDEPDSYYPEDCVQVWYQGGADVEC